MCECGAGERDAASVRRSSHTSPSLLLLASPLPLPYPTFPSLPPPPTTTNPATATPLLTTTTTPYTHTHTPFQRVYCTTVVTFVMYYSWKLRVILKCSIWQEYPSAFVTSPPPPPPPPPLPPLPPPPSSSLPPRCDLHHVSLNKCLHQTVSCFGKPHAEAELHVWILLSKL